MNEVLTGLLVAITGIYAFLTFRILEANKNVVTEMRRQSEELARPRISIFVHSLPSRPMFHLTVRNIGPSAATNLKLRLSKPFHIEKENVELSTTAAFSKIIPNFAPGEKIDFQLGRTFTILARENEDLRPLTFTIDADYWFGARHYVETTHIDLSVQMMTSLITDAIVEQMDKINRHLEEIAARVVSTPP